MRHYIRIIFLALTLILPLGMAAQDTVKWRDIHKVKRHETIFGIARSYGLSIQDIIDANPEMNEKGYELKKGDKIFIPYSKDSQQNIGKKGKAEKKSKSISKGKDKTYAVSRSQAPIKVGVMLPFLDHSSEGSRMVEYYRGIRAALDSLGKMGIRTEVNLWNLNKDSVVANVIKHNPVIGKQDIIFGPLYTSQVKPLADFCEKNNVRLVIPFSINANDVKTNSEVYQIYQDDESLTGRSVGAFIERFAKTHRPVFIDCDSPSDGKYVFTQALRKNLVARGAKVELTNINTPVKEFAKHFSATQPNVIVLNTASYRPLERVIEKLDSMKRIDPSMIISMYGYNEWFIYQPALEKFFYRYNVHIPTTYYFSRTSNKSDAFERNYLKKYGEPMNPDCLPRMALMGFDHTMYFLKGMAKYGKDYHGSEAQNTDYKPLQNRLEFKHIIGGGYQNSNFQVIRFKVNGTIDSLTY